jgi:hypothetical protein
VAHRKRVISALGSLAMLAAVIAAVLAAMIAGAAQAGSRTLALARPLPNLVRQKEHVTVRGTVTGVPRRTEVALELKRTRTWVIVANVRAERAGGFAIHWPVPKDEQVGPVSLRIAALSRRGALLAATASVMSAIGPAAVYCARPVPPMTNIPAGDGWILGGVYAQGGPYPGFYACSDKPYTITATATDGKITATAEIAANHSYTLIVPPGRYSLSSGPCRGQATVVAAKPTSANTYCDYP